MDDLENEVSSPPATMAEIFFALIAVVIMMLLALLPAIRKPQALAAPRPVSVWRADIRIGGDKPAKFVADAGGLRIARPKAKTIALDRLLDNTELQDALRSAAKTHRKVLLIVRPEGQEAAFLFNAAASRAGVETIYQLRVDAGCAYVADRNLRARCRARSRPGAAMP